MSIGSNITSSITGNIETALLVIHDYRAAAKEMGSTGGKKWDSALLDSRDSRLKAAEEKLSGNVPPTFPNSQDRMLRVQFNPSQLSIYASAIPQQKTDAATGQSRSIVAEDAQNLTLTTVLYFDDMDTYDSFMWEKFTSGLTLKGASNAVKAGMTAAGKGKVHSVQWQVESLIAALRNPFTRTISFRWADFVFVGELSAVKADYTMFSTSGRPVRAQVLLRIRHEMKPAMLKHWYSSFDTAFGEDAVNLVKNEQNYSSLINLNL